MACTLPSTWCWVGIDLGGKKHMLGLGEGATENAAAWKELLADLIERGLPTERALLFVMVPRPCARQ
jgi:transposase-like protein